MTLTDEIDRLVQAALDYHDTTVDSLSNARITEANARERFKQVRDLAEAGSAWVQVRDLAEAGSAWVELPANEVPMQKVPCIVRHSCPRLFGWDTVSVARTWDDLAFVLSETINDDGVFVGKLEVWQ